MTKTTLAHVPFFFLRHGQTDWNAKNVAQGATDVPLNDAGRDQARRAASILQHQTLRMIVSSPLCRATETASIIANRLALPVLIENDLREANFGVQDGRPTGPWYDAWLNEQNIPPHAESFSALKQRAIAAVNAALRNPGPVLVVGHGTFWRAIRDAAGHGRSYRTPNASPVIMTPPEVPHERWRMEEMPC